MHLKIGLLLLLIVVSVVAQEPKYVFAHFMVGCAAAMTQEDWMADIKLAKQANIDAFALNIGRQDSYTDAVLFRAYEAAAAVGDFGLFISFDYLSGGPWPMDVVIQTINKYSGHRSQFKYHNQPLVSTFEGTDNINDWYAIKSATGCFLVPDWSSLGLEGLPGVMNVIDGFFSWDAWPVGAQSKSSDNDNKYMSMLGQKPYMMPVSPWFYTNLAQWGKNWLWRGDDLWHERWMEVIALQPAMAEIISWNDYGESNYIGPIRQPGIPPGAEWYVLENPHDGWRHLLPAYIDLFKSNNASNPLVDHPSLSDTFSYWYRRNPGKSGSADGTTGNNPAFGQQPLDPAVVSEDKVFITAFVSAPSEIAVKIGQSRTTSLQASFAGINHMNVPFGGNTGPVNIKIMRDGVQIADTTGPEITNDCFEGKVMWNAFVGLSCE
ncbi:glycosyl hydrolase [Histoplasma capsulatum G186AR]|uniref:Glycosyl hydrolase n=2 Tax=Ajellomyces capsulatus TaxID=5037 RepID=C0NEA6_AJECG|nr:glycosyl hydrolase [Histoplasma capsulatum G186AR]EEH09577.1 glycosyl hydrolase [Histoplasma capsulatum G186AR]KAG5289006.1 glycosyl hydrolase [Histoplasma capsulatum]QSS73412.1 glycosyl hydrolase [Histoplasma capsulatum G186AR]